MKARFPGYYRPTADEFSALWKECLFALDANVLLNLYRYPRKAREELLSVLESLGDRTWIPFQAALEFQRNRPSIIAEQRKRFREVRDVLEASRAELKTNMDRLQLTKRHTSIDPGALVRNVTYNVDQFLLELEGLERSQKDVDQAQESDDLRGRIEGLLGDRIGKPPESQEVLDGIYAEGAKRYEVGMPPGFLDARKGEDAINSYSWGGLVYQTKYGDLLLWKEVIERAREPDMNSLVLLTDDVKADWWWIVDSEGNKRLGPRPELVEEIQREAKLERFYMYSSEQFLRMSERYLAATVTKESIEQVQNVAQEARTRSVRSYMVNSRRAETAVAGWVSREYPGANVQQGHRGFPDIVVGFEDSADTIGFEIVFLQNIRSLLFRMRDNMYRAYYETREGTMSRIEFVVVLWDSSELDEAMRLIDSGRFEIPPGIGFIVGSIVADENAKDGHSFVVFERRQARPLDGPTAD